MVDITPIIINEFEKSGILFIHENTADSSTEFPCVTYYISGDMDEAVGNNTGYSRITYTLNVWSKNYKELTLMSLETDVIMKRLGFVRKSSTEQNFSGLYRRIYTYEIIIKEDYKEEI